MTLRTRRLALPAAFAGLLFLLSASLLGAGAARQAAQTRVWEVSLAAGAQARSQIEVTNECQRTHVFTVVAQGTPYLQLPAPPTISVPARAARSMPVTFNTAAMHPGTYEGAVEVRCDTCAEERTCRQDRRSLPLRLTVTPAERPEPTPQPSPRPSPRPTPPAEVVTPAEPIATPPREVDIGASCQNDKCKVDRVILNTGYDHAAGAVYSALQPDGYWELVDAPKLDLNGDDLPDGFGTTTTLSLPSPPWVISPHPSWATLPDSRWLSAYQTNALDTNNPPPSTQGAPAYAPYSFQRCFCTCEGVRSVFLDLRVLADNTAVVSFDGVPLAGGSMLQNSVDNFKKGLEIRQQIPVSPGRHCLRVDVRNLSREAMGLNVSGTATSSPRGRPLFLSAACCSPTGKIIGRKFNDLNCNGRNDNQPTNQGIEPGLQGWVVTLTNTSSGAVSTATTDANGFYYFNNLAPGAYTVGEAAQPGWTQTVPGGGAGYTVNVKAGEVVQRDFGNCRRTDEACGRVAGREAVCKADGSGGYTFTFVVTNNSGRDVEQVLLTPPPGGGFTLGQQVFNLTTPLQSGDSTTLTVGIGSVRPGAEVCFLATLMSRDGPCCTVKVCPALPPCCGQVRDVRLVPVPGQPGAFDYTFTVFNMTPGAVEHVYLTPPPGVGVAPDYLPVSIPPGGGSVTRTVRITGAAPGSTVCLKLSLHSGEMRECCSLEHCLRIPGDATERPAGAVPARDR